MPDSLVLGVDGGNSKTLAVVADRTGMVLGVGRSGCGNHQVFGLKAALRQICLAADAALEQAGSDHASSAYFALAGADLPEDFALLQPALEGLELAGRTQLSNDTMAALWSGTDSANAVVVIWGAGTNAAGRNAAGQEIRLPGLGWISGDRGGGGDLGRQAISATARAWDGRGPATMLSKLVLELFGEPDTESLIARLYHTDPDEEENIDRTLLFEISPLVFKAAEAGDEVACDMIAGSGQEIVTTATALLRRLDILNVPADVVLAGGVFRSEHPLLIDIVIAGMRETAPHASVLVPPIEPALGAAFAALHAEGVAVGKDMRLRAGRSYARLLAQAPGVAVASSGG